MTNGRMTDEYLDHLKNAAAEPGSETPGGHSHGHTQQHTYTKAVINRLSRVIGHLESVRKMVEDGRDCSEVLIQLAAVKSAINSAGKLMLKDHMEHCIMDAVEHGNENAIIELNKAIERFL